MPVPRCEGNVKRVVAGNQVPPIAKPHRVLLPVSSPGPARQSLRSHISSISAVVENQLHRTPKDQQQRDDSGTAASIGANHGGLGSREEFFKALEQDY